ncbi:uncharacterized protein TrAFT101_002852 [Trichoderma asperellum]|uniref:uncharacterized protein n=1 Tax=Trichoderma asperellum TaxID=101201 RepID=UPI003319608F|nr:hypothetical protein TrAFT101_002852 [Trichoderma asperellum]
MAADSERNADWPTICRSAMLISQFAYAALREKRGAAVEPSIFRLVSEKILFPPPSLLERAKSTPTSRRLFPRGDELFLSVQTAQFRNYHPPYSNAIELSVLHRRQIASNSRVTAASGFSATALRSLPQSTECQHFCLSLA